MNKKILGIIAAGLLSAESFAMSGAPADAEIDNDRLSAHHKSWEYQALAKQSLLDNAAPYSQGFRLQGHNAFNSSGYSSIVYIDPNHTLTITEQLEIGVRSLELDAHWTWQTKRIPNGYDLLLCHGQSKHEGCSGLERYVRDGVEEINRWLRKNPKEVVAIMIQDETEGHYSELAAAFSSIHDLIYKAEPRDVYRSFYDVIPDLSEEDILRAGKQVIIMGPGNAGEFTRFTHSGSFSGMGSPNDFAQVDEAACIQLKERQTTNHRLFEDGTNIGQWFVGEGRISDALATKALKCGASALGADKLVIGDSRVRATIWSWGEGEPNDASGVEDCAESRANGRFNDADCNTVQRFACATDDAKEWSISAAAAANSVSGGEQACQQNGAQWHFSVPVNSQQNEWLKQAKVAAGVDVVWLNYRDQAEEGMWLTPAHQVAYGDGLVSLKALQPGFIYDFYMKSRERNCELQWTGGNAGSGERNAKFDCVDKGDTMMFVPLDTAQQDSDGNVNVRGYIKTSAGGYICGLEWDSNLSGGERNAKFDCSGSADPVTLISRSGGTTERIIIRTDNGCGLQWDADMDSDNERNAKFDCDPAYDEMTLYGTELPSEYRELRSAASGKCLDLWGEKAVTGAEIKLYDCRGSSNQKWKYETETGFIRTQVNPDFCLDNRGQTQDGGSLSIYPCVDHSNLRWQRDGNTFRSQNDAAIVIDAYGADNGSQVGQWSYHGGDNQQWLWGR